METITKRAKRPMLSSTGERVLAQYERRLRVEEDLSSVTIRNYLSDLRHFAAWCESIWNQGREEDLSFTPERVTTPTITDYRTYLQLTLRLKPNSINRSLISLKRYFAWLLSTGRAAYDPAKVVKLVGEEVSTPRHLDDQEEQALVACDGDGRSTGSSDHCPHVAYGVTNTRTLHLDARPDQDRQAEWSDPGGWQAQQTTRDSFERHSS